MKIFIQFAFFILLTSFSFSQSHDLNVHGEGGKLYLVHKVIAKENWYSVGRIYNVSPKEIAPYNGLTLEHPLGIGQELKIPLSHINFSQDGKKNADETFVPAYHELQSNETLAHVSTMYDKVPIENGKSKIILLRTGESRQGVVGLYQPGLPGEQSPGLSVRFMGINHSAIASYLVSLYCSLAVLVDDAIAVLDDVEIGKYHQYN